MSALDLREARGRRVRAAWVAWAKTQPNPKYSWLVPWDELPEADREADRCIADALLDVSVMPDAELFALHVAIEDEELGRAIQI